MIYRKWESSPIIVSFSTREKPIYEIPFPAVTICPESKSASKRYSHSTIIKRLMRYRNLTQEEYIPSIPFRKNTTSRNITWTLDEGYSIDDDMHTFPKRALYSGASSALKFSIIESNENIDQACTKSLQGFKVTLHTPTRVPRPSQQYFRVPLDAIAITAVKPVMVTTSKRVKDFKPEKRQCYFETEKYLKYFKLYTQRNCQLECLSNFTLAWCGCVGFFMPKENNTDICGSLSKLCMAEAEEIVYKSTIHQIDKIKPGKQRKSVHAEKVNRLNLQQGTSSNESQIPYCDCLPLCTDLSYEVETSTSAWDWIKMIDVYFPPLNTSVPREKSISKTSMIIYFKTNHFITTERHELYAILDMLGSFGGLLGLFTGFSILSLMEIIYFLTVRIICNIKLFGNWSGECENDVEKNLPELSSRRK
ncbi:hypothetical protein HUJ05_010128 [Dendroctonus ponderosae]|nr:hypothetical protein HUJ05_010128 [Dendroctonus ponderosae]